MAQTYKKRTASSQNQGGLASIIDAIGDGAMAKKEAEFKMAQSQAKVKSELVKAVLMKKMDEQSKIAGNPNHPQNPEQQYLMRRAKKENPLSQMMTMSEDPNQPFETSMPADQVVQTPRGSLATKAVDPGGKQAMLAFMTAYDHKKQSGQPIHPVATKIYERMKAKVNTGEMGKEETIPGGHKPNEIKAYLEYLQDEDKNPDIGTPENDSEIKKTIKMYRQAMGTSDIEPDSHVQNETFDDDAEATIKENMDFYKKSREEVIGALRKRGAIK